MSISELQPGQRFRGLLIHSVLNRGPAGATYLASHSVLKIPLVIKTFAQEEQRGFREAHLVARVNSPHVVGMVEAGFEDDTPFVIERYVDGIDLQELLRRLQISHRILPLHVVVPLVSQIARGLHAMHLSGVVHRSLEAKNLFIRGDGHAMLGDFGAVLDAEPAAHKGVASAPYFAAPEIWRGDAVDERADLYALGAMAHMLATGAPPFAGNKDELAAAHLERPYVPPASDRPDAAYLFTLIGALLAKRPEQRPYSAEHVARLLDRVVPEAPQLLVTSDTTAEIGGVYIELYKGDIASAEADVLVNAANWQLTMKTGVAEALRRAGGEEIEEQAVEAAPAAMGNVVWTGAGQLSACWVAHAVAALASAVCIQRSTLRVLLDAQALGAQSVVFPALGTGVGQVPMRLGAKLMLESIITFARLGARPVDRVEIALHDDDALAQWISVLGAMR